MTQLRGRGHSTMINWILQECTRSEEVVLTKEFHSTLYIGSMLVDGIFTELTEAYANNIMIFVMKNYGRLNTFPNPENRKFEGIFGFKQMTFFCSHGLKIDLEVTKLAKILQAGLLTFFPSFLMFL